MSNTTRYPNESTRRRLPLVDLVAHARALDSAARPRRSDLVTTATIWVAAVVATIGFVAASVVDGMLRVDRRA